MDYHFLEGPEERQGEALGELDSLGPPEPAKSSPQTLRPLCAHAAVCLSLCWRSPGRGCPLPLVCSVVRKFSLNQAKPLTWQPLFTSSCVASANRKPLAFPVIRHTPSARAVRSQLGSLDYNPESHHSLSARSVVQGTCMRPQAGDIWPKSTVPADKTFVIVPCVGSRIREVSPHTLDFIAQP